MSRSRFAMGWSALFGAALLGCSAGPPRPAGTDSFLAPPDGARDAQSDTDGERYFPLVDGMIYTYRTRSEDDSGLLALRVHRVDSAHGELLYKNGRRKRFAYTEKGVAIEGTDTFVIVTPVVEGATFRGQNGCPARIDAVGVVMDVAAGPFRDCVRVVETCSGDRRVRFSTTLCPATGIIAMDAESGMSFDHAELQSLGPPLDITDGTTVIPGSDGFVPPSSTPGPLPSPAATGTP